MFTYFYRTSLPTQTGGSFLVGGVKVTKIGLLVENKAAQTLRLQHCRGIVELFLEQKGKSQDYAQLEAGKGGFNLLQRKQTSLCQQGLEKEIRAGTTAERKLGKQAKLFTG